MRLFYLHELVGGSDHEFLVNLYTRVLNRWPDEGGYRHYLSRIEGKPEMRRATVIEIAHSQEAKNLGVALREETETPQPPSAAPAAATAVPANGPASFAPLDTASADVAKVLAEIEDLRRQLAPMGTDEAQDALERAEAGLRRLRAELDALHVDVCLALRQTMQDRLRSH